MRIKNFFLFILVFLFNFFICTANQESSSFKQIVDFEEELNTSTPLQSSIIPLKSYFDVQDDSKSRISESQVAGHVSKTDFFNKDFLNYIKEYYNKPEFTDLLTYDTSDICQFLKIVSDFNLDAGMTYVGLRLFCNKIKSCDFILNDATNIVIESLNEHLGRFFESSMEDIYQEEIQIIRKSLEKIILNRLSDDFTQVKILDVSNVSKLVTQDVLKFIQLSINNLQQKQELAKVVERLRQMVKSFSEIILEKTIWNDQKSEEIWTSFITISINLQKLALSGIIDHMDDIDDLLWSLTHSFCRFLNSFGIIVPIAVYEKIELDLKSNSIYFLEEPEQEDGIRTKKEHIYDALFKSKVRAYAFEKKGIIVQ